MSSKKLHSVQHKLKLLRILKKLKPSEREEIISKLSEEGINDLSETVFNCLYCDMSMDKKARKKLRKQLFHFENDLRFIANKDKPWQSRRKKLVTQSGGAIGAILATVVPIIASIIADRLKAK